MRKRCSPKQVVPAANARIHHFRKKVWIESKPYGKHECCPTQNSFSRSPKLIQHRSTERRLPKMLNVVHMLNAASAKINNRIELGRHLGKGPRACGPNSDSKCGKHHFFGNIVTEQKPIRQQARKSLWPEADRSKASGGVPNRPLEVPVFAVREEKITWPSNLDESPWRGESHF